MDYSQAPNLKSLTEYPPGTSAPRSVSRVIAIPPRTAIQRGNSTVMFSSSPGAILGSRRAAWPLHIEVLMGVIAGGLPELTYFLWWAFQADVSTSLDGPGFMVGAMQALLAGGAAGLLCRMWWPKAGPASLYRLLNTLVWTCTGSFAGYVVGGIIFGVNTPASHLAVPFCQGATMLLGMAYARCGGLAA